MLADLDETMHHQVPLPFDRVATSDHRFYDRVWFLGFDPSGSASIAIGMGIYKNMNVADGFSCVVTGDRQTNIRCSRPLRPDFSSTVGPLAVEVIEPFKEIRVALTDGASVAYDLRWHATAPAFLEGPWGGNTRLLLGRQERDVQRFFQTGTWDGWIRVGDSTTDVESWRGVRDHSWGVRPGVGDYEPINGPSMIAAGAGHFVGVCAFDSGAGLTGWVGWTEDGPGRVKTLAGAYRDPGSETDMPVVGVDSDIRFSPGTRDYTTASITVTGEDGSTHELLLSRPLRGTILKGYGGHSKGFFDGRGFGVYRGELTEEDEYDMNDPVFRNAPCDSPVSVTVDGMPGGWGLFTVFATGRLDRFGFGEQSIEELIAYGKASDNLGAD